MNEISNSIDMDLKREANSMDSLTYLWQAELENGTIIAQIDGGIEHKFQEVKDNFDKLVKFHLISKYQNQSFTVDLINGIIYTYNNLNIEKSEERKQNIRLIFFRRHRIEINEQNLQQQKHKIEYHLGFQYNTVLGENRKVLLQIDSEGNFIIGA